jgi:outer membrane protein assembly factor BamB
MDHHLYALDLENGEVLWDFKAGGALPGRPALSDGVLYFGGLNSVFYAVDAQTAQELWRFETEGWVWGGPLVHDDTVYFGDMSGRMYALDKSSGEERWAAFEAEGGVRVSPLLREGLLYFGTREKKFYAIRAEDGAQEWSISLDGSVYSQPVIYQDYLLVSPHNTKTKLLALDPDSGAERWIYPRQEE